MKKLISLLLLVSLLSACSSNDGSPAAVQPTPEKITLAGAGNLGIFDPSVERDPDTGRMWMSYSSVNTSSYSVYTTPDVIYWQVSIRLAYSDDNGVTWQDAGFVATPAVETLVGPLTESHPTGDIPANSLGIWQSETSSLVYDPSAPVNERWKLIWHQYLNANLTSYFADYAWIALKMASTPEGLETATAIKLFGGFGLQADNTITTPPVFAPIGGAPMIQLNTDLSNSIGGADRSELDFCIFAEPGFYASDTSLYLASYCADVSTVPLTEYIVYFRCTGPCNISNAASWEYVGRLLSPADAQTTTGDHHYQAPAIVERDGSTYLIVTQVDTTLGDRYNGCKVYEFADIDSNQLIRDMSNILVEVRSVGVIDGDDTTHFGACDTFSELDGGILLSENGNVGTADTFKIYKSEVRLP
ncbi:sialidase family protein [Kaarinaea lacus]